MTSRDRNGRDLERRLRDERPRPSEALVHAVANLVGERPRRGLRPRVAFAFAMTSALLLSATALGGVNAVAVSAKNAVTAVSKTVSNGGNNNNNNGNNNTTTTTTTPATTTTTPASTTPATTTTTPASTTPATTTTTPASTTPATTTTTTTTTTTPASAAPAASASGNGNNTKIDICHATGSSSNPYVLINVDANGQNGHGGHPGDIIPAPPTGCPGPSPGGDQYQPGKGCGDKNHVHFREGECKNTPK